MTKTRPITLKGSGKECAMTGRNLHRRINVKCAVRILVKYNSRSRYLLRIHVLCLCVCVLYSCIWFFFHTGIIDSIKQIIALKIILANPEWYQWASIRITMFITVYWCCCGCGCCCCGCGCCCSSSRQMLVVGVALRGYYGWSWLLCCLQQRTCCCKSVAKVVLVTTQSWPPFGMSVWRTCLNIIVISRVWVSLAAQKWWCRWWWLLILKISNERLDENALCGSIGKNEHCATMRAYFVVCLAAGSLNAALLRRWAVKGASVWWAIHS